MRLSTAILALTLGMSPLVAAADEPSAPPAGAPPASSAAHPNMAAFRDLRHHMGELHRQLRTQTLAALTPEHRALLAKLVGQLAVASNPDPHATADELDRALSPEERQAVLAADTQFRTQMKQLHEQFRQQLAQAGMPAHPGAPGQPGMMPMRHHDDNRTPDAGRVLLHAVSMPAFPGGGHGGQHHP